ncbi:disulfide bond formation protein B [Steroidobacter sp.]|uniref:disulfide bond formation protein B n=1 Tax=Steroidobacter sp. TaxID=1978227 RepID=UPI001A3916F2|nr:disulfide bond formation protein B [Steroidobacter sp.]MBL8271799.1 disulfide bond formation protein B [Steroidobacter sp.]
MLTVNRRAGNALGFLACAALMGYALYAQHVLGLEPCPLCIFQRVAVISVGVLFLLAALHNPSSRGGAIGYGLLIDLAALIGIGISARHIWIQAQPPGSVAACGADLNYLLEIMPVTEVVNKVLFGSGECGKIDWTLLGLSMPWWVLIALVGLGSWAVLVNIVAKSKKSRANTLRF